MLIKFDKYVEDGLISRKVSPCGRLVLFDYTEKCQFEKAWDDVTLNARGTVYELSTGAVVARAFPKFFNFSELSSERQEELMSQSFTVAEKMDGSLGIVYFYDGEWRVNTRGSFESDQAKKAKEMLESQVGSGSKLKTEYTYLVEIIYPENRIVVDYKNEEKLAFLASYHTENGFEAGHMPFKNRATYYNLTFADITHNQKTLSFNEEGYVVKFTDGTRVKFKGEEYVRMHRIISGMSPLVLWESMKNGRVCRDLLASIPEEFRSQYEEMTETLETKFNDLYVKIVEYSISIANHLQIDFDPTPEDRKTLGLYLKDNEHELNGFMFPQFLGKGLYEMITKSIKPKGNIL